METPKTKKQIKAQLEIEWENFMKEVRAENMNWLALPKNK